MFLIQKNINKVKCQNCNDILTDREYTVYIDYKRGHLPLCYQCSQKRAEFFKKKYEDEVKPSEEDWSEYDKEQLHDPLNYL
jgi:NAD-dependent SIR2 family protein deacetylase